MTFDIFYQKPHNHNEQTDMVKIVTGPIVGMVTRSSVRILLEFDSNVNIDITATEKMTPESQTTINHKFYANRAKAVTISDLKEKTEYIFSFRTNQDDVRDEDIDIEQIDEKVRSLPVQKSAIEDAIEYKARAITLGSHLQNIRVAVVSGNDAIQQQGVDLFNIIDEKIFKNQMRPLDAVFHVGNQINARELFVEARKLLESGAEEDAACDVYRAAYRKAFKPKAVKDLLGKVGNFFIASERDIGIPGDKLTQRDELDERTAKAARRVYAEYQRQLWTSEPVNVTRRHEGHAHLFGDHLGILFLDQLFDKYLYGKHEGYLSQQQWDDIELLFATPPEVVVDEDNHLHHQQQTQEPNNQGLFANIKGLVVVTNEPILFIDDNDAFGSVKTKINEKGLTRDNWAQGHHLEERDKLLSMLFNWKSANPLRQVLIVSGNSLGCGGHTLIKDSNNNEMTQFVSAPIASSLVLEGTTGTINREGKSGSFWYNHFDWICDERNFGIVDVFHSISTAKPMFEHFIIREKSTSTAPKTGGTWVIEEVKEKGGCCAIA
jgi:hypothetical protein